MKVSSIDNKLAEAVIQGLSAKQKYLPSWLMYDEVGDKLFQQIMHLPEYYPTRCEYEILNKNRNVIAQYFSYDHKYFELIELGAGDGTKTEILLNQLINLNIDFIYRPVDVSENVLNVLIRRLKHNLPQLKINASCNTYEEAIRSFDHGDAHKIIMFLGASIGNYTVDDAQQFLKLLSDHVTKEDLLFIGFDLKKDPRVISEAYDDKSKVTEQFNLNILHRLNQELDANFAIGNFIHFPFYNPVTGEAKSYLLSTCDQTVILKSLNRKIFFKTWETIYTEISQKYDLAMIKTLAQYAGLEIVEIFYDQKKYFCDILFRKKYH